MRQAKLPEALSRLDAFNRLWRRRRVFAGVLLATIGATVLALAVLPVRYMATASVIVAEPEPGVANTPPAWAQKIGDPADLESQLLVIHSPRLLRDVMNAPGVTAAVVQDCERGQPFGAAERCEKLASNAAGFIDFVDTHYAVASAGRSRVINISYQSAIPEVAQKLANALTNAFLQDQRNEGASSREVATSWLWQELKRLDGQLRAADEKIQEFRRNKGLMRGANAPITSERLTSIGQQLAAAEAARAESLARLKEIKSEQAKGLSDAPPVLQSRTIADLKQQLTTVTAQLASATSVLGPKHPSILALGHEQASIQQRLAEEMQTIAASAQKTFEANDGLVTSLKKQMDSAKADAGSATVDEASIESMVRDTEIKRQQYADLYKKASELETERRVLVGSTRLVSLAELPTKPFFPKKLPFLAAGLTLGLILGIAAALLADQLHLSPQLAATAPAAPADKQAAAVPITPAPAASRDLGTSNLGKSNLGTSNLGKGNLGKSAAAMAAPGERMSPSSMTAGAPIVARLPALKRPQAISAVGAILQGHAAVSLAEALRLAERDAGFQQMLANLALSLRVGAGEPVRRIAVTSPGSGHGKTLTALALAQHAARAGCRVLAVECDLRQPAFARALSIQADAGMAEVLSGAISLDDAIAPTADRNLDVVLAGEGSANLADQLFGASLASLLARLRGYDIVLADSPLPPGKTGYLAGMDGILLCMRGESASMGRVAAAVAGARACGATNIAIAVTFVEPDRAIAHQGRPTAAEAYARAG